MMETPHNQPMVWQGAQGAWTHSQTLPNMWVDTRGVTTTVRCLGYGKFETRHLRFKMGRCGQGGAFQTNGRGCARIQWLWLGRGGPGASNETLHHQWNLLVASLCTSNARLTRGRPILWQMGSLLRTKAWFWTRCAPMESPQAANE